MREYGERLGQFLLRKSFAARPTSMACGTVILKYFACSISRRGVICVRFGRVNEIKTKQVFLLAGTHMKAVAIIGRVRDESAIFQAQSIPLIDLVREDQHDAAPKNNNGDERAYAHSRENRRGMNQTATLPHTLNK